MIIATIGVLIGGRLLVFPPPLEHVHFATAQSETHDDAGMIDIEIERNGDIDRAVDVDYATMDGSAKAGDDYEARSGRLTFAAGESRQRLTIDLRRDTTFQRERRHFSVALRNVRGEPRHKVVIAPVADARTDVERIEQSVRSASQLALDVAEQAVHKRVLHDLAEGSEADSAEAAVYRESLAVTNENLTRAREAYMRVMYDLRAQPPAPVLGAMDRVAGKLKTDGYLQQAHAVVVMKRQLLELLEGRTIDMDRWTQELSAVVPALPKGGGTRT